MDFNLFERKFPNKSFGSDKVGFKMRSNLRRWSDCSLEIWFECESHNLESALLRNDKILAFYLLPQDKKLNIYPTISVAQKVGVKFLFMVLSG